MPEPSNPPPPPGQERPKRKYTVSDKVRAANRLNLVQANANPEKKYGPTPKRKASTYANCLKAREGKRQKRRRGQATGVKYGLAVTDLYSTLGLADASREELDGHYQYFRDRIKPAYEEEDKLTKALAECSWRRSQVLHVHAVDGVMLMKARLMMASDAARDNVSLRSLALLMMDVFNRRRPDLEEQLGILTRHFERLSFLLLALRGEHEGFGRKIRWGQRLGRGARLIEELRDLKIKELLQLPAEALGNPFVSAAKVEEILREKSNEIKPLEEMKWKGKKKQQEERQQNLQKECEEATYGGYLDPYGDPEKVERTGTTDYVQGDGRTQAVVSEDEPKTMSPLVEGTALVAGLRTDEWSEEQERKLVAELRRQWIETSEQLRKEGKETVGGVDLEELAAALEAGFGTRESGEEERESGVGGRESGEEKRDSGVGSRGSEEDRQETSSSTGKAPDGSTEPEEEEPEEEQKGSGPDGSSSPTPDSRPPTPFSSPTPDSRLPTPNLHEVVATAWDRVRFLEWWSRWERGEMKAILQGTGRHLDQHQDRTARTVLEALLNLFRGYKKILFEAQHYEAKLQDALFRFLSQFYGGDPGFQRPSPWWTDPELYKKMKEGMEAVGWAN
ncbi:MAG TPA: hypothetical protein VKM93_04460 [Terriglobia bacterium]|nr:hypothetical protein [Terriglobia bacterium]